MRHLRQVESTRQGVVDSPPPDLSNREAEKKRTARSSAGQVAVRHMFGCGYLRASSENVSCPGQNDGRYKSVYSITAPQHGRGIRTITCRSAICGVRSLDRFSRVD